MMTLTPSGAVVKRGYSYNSPSPYDQDKASVLLQVGTGSFPEIKIRRWSC